MLESLTFIVVVNLRLRLVQCESCEVLKLISQDLPAKRRSEGRVGQTSK
jgi:hypothetical protein